MLIAHTSDLHLSEVDNLEEVARAVVKEVRARRADVFLIAGDIAITPEDYRDALSILVNAAPHVAIVPGNTCLWVDRDVGDYDSLEKLNKLLPQIATETGVVPLWKKPLMLGSLAIVGTYGHYDYSFGVSELMSRELMELHRFNGKQRPDAQKQRWDKFSRGGNVSETFTDDRLVAEEMRIRLELQLQEMAIKHKKITKKIAVVHTAPFKEGIVYRGEDELDVFNAFSGSERLGEVLALHDVRYCVFGHTHIPVEFEVQGVRCVNSGLGAFSPGGKKGASPREYAEKVVRFVDGEDL